MNVLSGVQRKKFCSFTAGVVIKLMFSICTQNRVYQERFCDTIDFNRTSDSVNIFVFLRLFIF